MERASRGRSPALGYTDLEGCCSCDWQSSANLCASMRRSIRSSSGEDMLARVGVEGIPDSWSSGGSLSGLKADSTAIAGIKLLLFLQLSLLEARGHEPYGRFTLGDN